MSYLFLDPKFWLLISFITFIILMIKPFKSMMIGGLDSKIAEIKENINKSLESFTAVSYTHLTLPTNREV